MATKITHCSASSPQSRETILSSSSTILRPDDRKIPLKVQTCLQKVQNLLAAKPLLSCKRQSEGRNKKKSVLLAVLPNTAENRLHTFLTVGWIRLYWERSCAHQPRRSQLPFTPRRSADLTWIYLSCCVLQKCSETKEFLGRLGVEKLEICPFSYQIFLTRLATNLQTVLVVVLNQPTGSNLYWVLKLKSC